MEKGLNWDNKITDNFLQEWNIWRENVIKLSLRNPPRWINFSSDSEIAELHIFADDSNMACGTCTPVKYQTRQKAGFPIVTETLS